jgi:peptide-methionine (S)-S-oxide reductase
MRATFAAGCFWGVEEAFRQLPGVLEVQVGYTGGHTENPTYEEVCSGTTGHAEAVELEYDPDQISYDQLLDAFFAMHNAARPTKAQYRSAIFVHSPEQQSAALARTEGLATEVEVAGPFYRAEEYHQHYMEKNR